MTRARAIATLALVCLPFTLAAQDPAAATPDTLPPSQRDAVGDLNAEAVRAGDLPGGIILPGLGVTLRIGGFVKAVAIMDSNLDVSGAMLLPATFESGADVGPNFAMDATKSRLFFEAYSRLDDGSLRGYVEWDFNQANNGEMGFAPRLAYGSWESGPGSLLAGHNWSTFMDLKLIPESMTEPTLSGAILSRQAQIRWTQKLPRAATLAVAIEDPSVGDFAFREEGIGKAGAPDLIAAAELPVGAGHVRLGGIVRRVQADDDVLGETTTTGWGLSLSGRWGSSGGDWLGVWGSYGKGIARYLLGSGPRAGGFVDAATGDLRLLESYGGIVSLRHRWSSRLRSGAGFGGAWGERVDVLPVDAFRSTTYGFLNVMFSPRPFVTVGAEYAFARLSVADGTATEDHRVVFGVQVY